MNLSHTEKKKKKGTINKPSTAKSSASMRIIEKERHSKIQNPTIAMLV